MHPVTGVTAILAAVVLGAPSARAQEAPDFPAYVWRGPHGTGDEREAELLAPFGGVVVIGADEAEWVRERGLDSFVFNAPGRDALHVDRLNPAYQARWKAWYAERDDGRLIRRPCLTDPKTRAELHARLQASLAARAGRHGHGVSLGDEVSLTPDGSPGDDCLSPTCRAAWERARGAGDMARYSTDAVRRELSEGNSTLLGGWLARRRFHQDVVLELLAELARAVREQDPRTPVGLLGLGGQTAFGNVAVERALPFLDFIECYPVSDARELMFTLRAPEQRAWATIFPDPERPNLAATEAWEHWMRGGDGVVVWEAKVLAQAPELAARTALALGDIRRVRQQVPAFRPRPRGVAVVHSPDSIAVSWLRDALLDGPTWPNRLQGYHEERGTLERSLDAWLRRLEQLGAMPGALPVEALDAATVERFGVLIANHLLVLSDAQVAALARFLAAGGTLIVDGELGAFDPAGRRRAEGAVLAELRSASERVLDAARARLPELSIECAPWRMADEPSNRANWLATWSADERGGWTCATLPQLAGELVPRRISIEAPDGYSVEWIHPAPRSPASTTLLPAGDAAVFRLVREGT